MLLLGMRIHKNTQNVLCYGKHKLINLVLLYTSLRGLRSTVYEYTGIRGISLVYGSAIYEVECATRVC